MLASLLGAQSYGPTTPHSARMLELEHGFRVLDVHATLDEREDAAARGRAVEPERLAREMHQAGVRRALVAPTTREGGYLRANNAVARLTVDRPFEPLARLAGVRSVGRGASVRNVAARARRREHHTAPQEVEQYAYDDRYRGFKLHPAADGLPDGEVLEALAEVGLPVLVHAGRGYPPGAVEETLLSHDFPVVLEHFGGYPLDRELMAAAIELLDDHESLYLDTAAVRFRAPLERALREHPDRVLFGSGAPGVHHDVAVMELLTLDLPEDAMRRAFAENPERVFDAVE